MHVRKAAVATILAALGILALYGCSDQKQSSDNRESDIVSTQENRQSGWLRVEDRTDPAVWLAERETGRRVASTDPAAQAFRKALATAGERFLESDRMLANRTAQLGEMLASDGRPESYVVLLVSLTATIADTANGKRAYGDLCQFYLNLRRAGVDRNSALNSLAKHANLKRLR